MTTTTEKPSTLPERLEITNIQEIGSSLLIGGTAFGNSATSNYVMATNEFGERYQLVVSKWTNNQIEIDDVSWLKEGFYYVYINFFNGQRSNRVAVDIEDEIPAKKSR